MSGDRDRRYSSPFELCTATQGPDEASRTSVRRRTEYAARAVLPRSD
jgi:hypothetical protein